MATTSGNSEPLSHVNDDGTDSPLAFPAIVPQEGWKEVQRLRARSRERPRRSPSRRTVSLRRPPSPRCPGNWLRLDGASEQSPDPPQGAANPPVHGRQKPQPGGASAFGPVHRGLEHGRDRLQRPEQCPAADKPELEDRVQALTGPAPRHQFHPGPPCNFLVTRTGHMLMTAFLQSSSKASRTSPARTVIPVSPAARASSTNPTA